MRLIAPRITGLEATKRSDGELGSYGASSKGKSKGGAICLGEWGVEPSDTVDDSSGGDAAFCSLKTRSISSKASPMRPCSARRIEIVILVAGGVKPSSKSWYLSLGQRWLTRLPRRHIDKSFMKLVTIPHVCPEE